jgi:hypothetical protein
MWLFIFIFFQIVYADKLNRYIGALKPTPNLAIGILNDKTCIYMQLESGRNLFSREKSYYRSGGNDYNQYSDTYGFGVTDHSFSKKIWNYLILFYKIKNYENFDICSNFYETHQFNAISFGTNNIASLDYKIIIKKLENNFKFKNSGEQFTENELLEFFPAKPTSELPVNQLSISPYLRSKTLIFSSLIAPIIFLCI